MGRVVLGLLFGYVGLGLMYDNYYHNKLDGIRKNEGVIEAIKEVQNPSLSQVLLKILFRPIMKISIELRLDAIRRTMNKCNKEDWKWRDILY